MGTIEAGAQSRFCFTASDSCPCSLKNETEDEMLDETKGKKLNNGGQECKRHSYGTPRLKPEIYDVEFRFEDFSFSPWE